MHFVQIYKLFCIKPIKSLKDEEKANSGYDKAPLKHVFAPALPKVCFSAGRCFSVIQWAYFANACYLVLYRNPLRYITQGISVTN